MTKKGLSVGIVTIIFMTSFIGYANLEIKNEVLADWEPEFVIATGLISSEQPWDAPSIGVENDKVHVVWMDGFPMPTDIYYRHFDGSSWQPEQNIVHEEYLTQSSMVASNGKVHVIWTLLGNPMGDYRDIYYTYFNGTAWQPKQELTIDVFEEQQRDPAITVDGDELHAVWLQVQPDDRLQYRHYNGSAWESIQEFDQGDGEWESGPSIAAENGKVYMVWVDGPLPPLTGNISFRYYNGTAWQPEETISTDITGDEEQGNPHIAAENEKAYVVYTDSKDGDRDIYYRHFNGTLWEPEVEISQDLGTEEQKCPRIAVDNGKIYVVWQDEGDGDWDIYYRYFDGTIWQPIEEVSTDSGTETQILPNIATDDYKVHVVWKESLDNFTYDIHYRRYVPLTIPQPDLEITIDDIVFNPGSPVENGTSVLVNATIHNIGTADAFNVVVRFYDDFLGLTQIGVDQIIPFIPVGGIGQVEVEWIATGDVDLEISENDINFDPSSPVANGTSVMINATIHNTGQTCSHNIVVFADPDNVIWEFSEANNDAFKTMDVFADVVSVEIKFYDGSGLADMIGNDTTESIAGGDIAIAVILLPWTATPPGLHDIYVVVDPDNMIPESNESNNIANKTIKVVELPMTTIHVGLPQYGTIPRYVSSSTQFWFSVIDSSDTGYNTYYYIDTPPWNLSTGLFSVPAEGVHTIYFNSTDNLGGIEETKEFDIIVDNTPPVTTISPDSKNVKIGTQFTLTADDDGCGVNYTEYYIDGDDWDNYTSPFSIDTYGHHNITYRSVDYLGNVETEKKLWIHIPKDPITTIHVGTPQYGTTPLYVTSSTQFIFTIEDYSGSGYNTYYYVDNPPWNLYSGAFAILVEDEHTIYFNSTDNLGNVEDTKNYTAIVDNTSPTTTISPNEMNAALGTVFTLNATDGNGSGVNYTQYFINGSNWMNYSGPFTLSTYGHHNITFRSVDNLGNVESEKILWVIIPPPEVITEEEYNYKPLIALIFTIVLLLIGSIIFHKRPLKIVKENKWYTWMVVVLLFVVAEALTGVISMATDILSVPPLLGAGMFVDLTILIVGLVLFIAIYMKSGKQ